MDFFFPARHYAIISLVGETLPVNAVLDVPDENDSDLQVFLRIESPNETIFSGNIVLPDSINFTASNSGTPYTLTEQSVLMALLQAAQEHGFTVSVNDAYYPGFGFFVDSIDGVNNQGFNGWVYAVDYFSGQVSADNFFLDSDNEEIIWYYSESFDQKLLHLVLSDTSIEPNQSITATVEYFNEPSEEWVALENASIKIDGRNETFNTDSNGNAIIAPNFSGSYDFFAEKQGFTRSNRINVSISSGNPQIPGDSGTVELTAFVVPAVSIIVDPSLLDFGSVGAGYSINGPAITITNNGSHNIMVTAEVVGNLFVQSLKINNVLWNVFELLINADPNDFINSVPVGTQLDVPEDLNASGQQSGTLTFWASSTGTPV